MEPTQAVKTKWVIDEAHSEILFKVKHLVISTVTGSFREFESTIMTDQENFEGADASFIAQIRSISTNNSQRDEHLKSDDFFNASQFPFLSFKGGSYRHVKGDLFELTGDMTIKDITKEVTLKVRYGGIAKDAYDNTKAGFEIEGLISRKEFGLTWNATTEAGGVVVGDEVKLIANVQFTMEV